MFNYSCLHFLCTSLPHPSQTLNYCYFFITITQFVYSPVDKHLDCFQFFTIRNNIAVSICIQVCVAIFFISLGWMSRNRIAGNRISYGKCMFNLIRSCHTVFLQDYTTFHSHQQGINVLLMWHHWYCFIQANVKLSQNYHMVLKSKLSYLLKSYVNVLSPI